MGMNPHLMKLTQMIVKLAAAGGEITPDAELSEYVKLIQTLDAMHCENPAEWPWNDQQDCYMKILRQLIGNFPLVTPVAVAVVLDENARILLEQRSDNGKWSIPSGTIEPGESVRTSVTRELAEETGLIARCEDLHLFDEFSGKLHVYPHGDVISSVKLIYVIKKYSGELQPNYESTRLDWFSLHEIPHTASGSTKKIAEMLSDRATEVARMS